MIGPRATSHRPGVPLASLLGLFFWGCALWPQLGPPPPVGPPRTRSGSRFIGQPTDPNVTAGDSLAFTLPEVAVDTLAARVPPPRPRAVTPPAAAAPRDTVVADTTARVGSPPISIDLPAEEGERLTTRALQDLEVARSLLDSIHASRLSAADLEKYQTVRGWITQTERAIDANDPQAAANLAKKARLLAAELTTR